MEAEKEEYGGSRQGWECDRQGLAGVDSGHNDNYQMSFLQTGYAHI